MRLILIYIILFAGVSCYSAEEKEHLKLNQLTSEEKRIIIDKGTERPFTGKFLHHTDEGTYFCRQCNTPLYKSSDKFDSHCGWPSFDDEIPGAVERHIDADGIRTEIVCAACGGHLGHVFEGEQLTHKNIRHCVNSISLDFIPEPEKSITARAIFASGCFWGTEYHLQKVPGVLSTSVGYIGGHVKNPTYEQVCSGTSGHAEAVEVLYNPETVSFESLARLFFETHDPTQVNRQGPDIGEQYRSEIFYLNEQQRIESIKLIDLLEQKGLKVATQVSAATEFYPAEKYHQDYYKRKGSTPYCHIYTPRF